MNGCGCNNGGYNNIALNNGGYNNTAISNDGYNNTVMNNAVMNNDGYNNAVMNKGNYNNTLLNNNGGCNRGVIANGGYNQGDYNHGGYNHGGCNHGGGNHGNHGNHGGWHNCNPCCWPPMPPVPPMPTINPIGVPMNTDFFYESLAQNGSELNAPSGSFNVACEGYYYNIYFDPAARLKSITVSNVAGGCYMEVYINGSSIGILNRGASWTSARENIRLVTVHFLVPHAALFESDLGAMQMRCAGSYQVHF